MYLVKPNSSTPYYQVIYFINRNRMTKSTKERLKSKALEFLSRFESELRKKPQLVNITLEQFASEYLEYLKIKFSRKYVQVNDDTLRVLQERIGNPTITELKVSQVENFLLSIYSQAKYSAYLHFRNLRAAFNSAVERNYIKENFLQRYKFPKLPKSNPIFINDTELKQILSCVENETLKDMYFCYFHTGTRLNELIHLKWNAVDLQQRVLKIKNQDDFTIKTKEERIIPLNSITFDILQKRFPHIVDLNGYVFTKANFKFNGDYVSKQFKKACRQAGFNDLHLHQLRHSFCSNLIKKNVSIRVVMELAGHSNLATTQKYMHVKNESLYEAVKALEC